MITKNELEDFLGGRIIDDNIIDYINKNNKLITTPLYRGLPYPKKFIKKGNILNEWYGSCHFSFNREIAENFAIEEFNGYINDSYLDELNIDYSEMVPLILVSNKTYGTDMSNIIRDTGLELFKKEQEVVTIGYSYIIEEIKTYLCTRTSVPTKIYIAEVKQIENKYLK